MIRKSYLITKAMKSYIIASLLTTAIGQINGIVDGILMGQFIGPNALSAISMVMPAMAFITVFYILLAAGATLLASKAIGERDFEKVSSIFTVSITSLLVIGIVVSILGWIYAEPIVRLVCNDDVIFPYAYSFMKWTMGLSFITMLSQAFSQFTDVDGKPLVVTKAMTVSMICNIILDIILVPICQLGIHGSAIASALSLLGSGIYLLFHLFGKGSSYRFHIPSSGYFSILRDNVKNGTAMMIGVFLTSICAILMNNMIVSCLGPNGMFTMSISISLMGIGTMLSSAASQSFMSVGSMLLGQKDYRGMRMLYRRCLILIIASSALFTVIGQICPEAFAYMFGAHDPELVETTASGVRIFTLMLIPFMLLTFLPSVYQVLGHLKIVGIVGGSFFVILIPAMYSFSISSDPSMVWWSFPIAAFGGSVLCAVSLYFVNSNTKDCGYISLIPQVDPYHTMLDISIPCNEESRDEAFGEIRQFIKNLDVPSQELKDNISVCTEELLDNIVGFSGMSPAHYIDVRITCQDEYISVMTKDDGHAFDPISFEAEHRGLGLTIIHSLCPKVEYKYMYSQNMSFMTWYKDDSKNEYKRNIGLTDSQLDALLNEPEKAKGKKKSSDALLSLRGIHKTYHGATPLHVLKGVDLDIHEGELVSIMGASGSGKSTLLNVIGILDDYDEGEYRLGGHLIKNLSEDEQASFRNELIGFIFQTFNLILYKNALDNVALPLMYRGVDRETRNKLAMEYLTKVGLEEHWNHTPMQMSGGQRQRVAIARALIQHPKIILADEPTGALDSKTTQEVMDMLREVNRKEGQTVIIVTHEQEIADQTDRRIFFKDGLIFRDEKAKS